MDDDARDEIALLSQKIDHLAWRIEHRAREYAQLGQFSTSRQALSRRISAHRAELQQMVQDARASGASWKLLQAELSRYVALFADELTLISQKLDAAQMKNLRLHK
jgi:hypothetical protein